MQNRYSCDVGDFAKYSLLNALAERDLHLGVLWYLNALEENNDDGSFIDYAELRGCNEGLYLLLQSVLQSGKRNLTAIEQSGILPPRTRFFSDPLPVNPQRQGWLAAAAEAVAAADVVFLDPDNGLTESPDAYRRKPQKYVSIAEVAYFQRRRQSVVIYQHQTRNGTFEDQLERHCTTLREIGASAVWALTFHRRSTRAFLIIPADRHVSVLEERCRRFIQSAWGREGHFRFKIHTTYETPRAPIRDTTSFVNVRATHVARTDSKTGKKTTEPGYTNRNGQTVVRPTDLAGTDYGQRVYVLKCGSCRREYGANGSDIFQRRCPSCQGGKPGLPIR
jgi:hypothetical protein